MARSSIPALALAAVFATAGCGSREEAPPPRPAPPAVSEPEAPLPVPPPRPARRDSRGPDARVYECPGMDATVATVRNGVVALFLPERTLILSYVPAGTGEQYASGAVSLFVTDNEILLELGGEPVRCSENRKRSLWEDARLRGVDYRAVGNEPGWVLEIGPEWVTFDYDYGTANAIFPALEPIVDATNRRTIYAGDSPAHEVRITVGIGPCRDSMSEDVYATSAEVVLDGRTFRGCGRALH